MINKSSIIIFINSNNKNDNLFFSNEFKEIQILVRAKEEYIYFVFDILTLITFRYN